MTARFGRADFNAKAIACYDVASAAARRAWDDGGGASHERPCGRRRLEPRPSRRGGQRRPDPRERPAVVALDDRPRSARGAGVRVERAGGEGTATREPHRVADDPRRPELVRRRSAGLRRVAALHPRLRRRHPHRRDPDPPHARVPERAASDARRAVGDGGDVCRRAGAAAGVVVVRRPPRAQVRRMPAQCAADRARRAARGRARHRHAHRRTGDLGRRPCDPHAALARGVSALAAGTRTGLPRLGSGHRLRRHPDRARPVHGGRGGRARVAVGARAADRAAGVPGWAAAEPARALGGGHARRRARRDS